MRYMGIDYGRRRIGMAVADEETGIAIPRGIMVRKNDEQAINEIKALIQGEGIGKIIMGLPVGLDGKGNEMVVAVRAFARKLSILADLPIEFESEILTTRMARREGIDVNNIDAASAAIILQSYLDRVKNQNSSDQSIMKSKIESGF